MINTLEEVDVFLPNETEIRKITRCTDVVDGLRKLHNGHTLVVAKLGAEGCMVLSEGNPIKIDAFAIEVADTTGAGDTFCGALAARLAEGASFGEALAYGNAAGAIAVTRKGAQTSIPMREEIEALIG